MTVDLGLLNINDFHGRIDANTVAFAAHHRAAARCHRGRGWSSILLSAGDNIGAVPVRILLAGRPADHRRPQRPALLGIGRGNHEFDKGFSDLVDRVIANGDNAQFPTSARTSMTSTGSPVLPEYSLQEVGGVTVGVIGAITQDPLPGEPGWHRRTDLGDPVEAVNCVAAQLTDKDESNGEADLIVPSTTRVGSLAGRRDPRRGEAAGGAFADIVNETSPEVDVIFTGQHARMRGTAPGARQRTALARCSRQAPAGRTSAAWT